MILFLFFLSTISPNCDFEIQIFKDLLTMLEKQRGRGVQYDRGKKEEEGCDNCDLLKENVRNRSGFKKIVNFRWIRSTKRFRPNSSK